MVRRWQWKLELSRGLTGVDKICFQSLMESCGILENVAVFQCSYTGQYYCGRIFGDVIENNRHNGLVRSQRGSFSCPHWQVVMRLRSMGLCLSSPTDLPPLPSSQFYELVCWFWPWCWRAYKWPGCKRGHASHTLNPTTLTLSGDVCRGPRPKYPTTSVHHNVKLHKYSCHPPLYLRFRLYLRPRVLHHMDWPSHSS